MAGGPAVARNEVNLVVWDQPVDWPSVSLHSMTTSPLGYSYNVNGIVPMNAIVSGAAHFHVWLPDGAIVEGASVRPAILRQTTEFSGRAGLFTKDDKLYPAIPARLHAEAQPGTAYSTASIKYLSSKMESFTPPVKAGSAITGYAFGSLPAKAMEADGTFLSIPNYTSGSGPYLWSRIDKEMYQDGVDFYAMWEDAVYTFRFEANRPQNASTSIEGSTPDRTCKYMENITPVNGYILKGYTFMGWNLQADGKGRFFVENRSISPQMLGETETHAYTLYAVWSPQEYSVTFTPGDGTGRMKAQQMAFDQPSALEPQQFTPPVGGTFVGWRRTPILGGKLYEDGATVCNLCSIATDGGLEGYTLEAQWADADSFVVVLIHNDGPLALDADKLILTTSASSQFKPFSKVEGSEGVYACDASAIPAGEYTLTLSGVDGKGVAVAPAAGGVVTLRYASAEMIDADPHVTQWLEERGTLQKPYVRVGTSLAIGASAEAGYRFERFTAIGYQPVWQDNDPTIQKQEIAITGQTLLSAHADAVSYCVRFHKNSDLAGGEMQAQDMRYGEPQALRANAFTRAGYKLGRWAAQPDGSGASYAPGATVQDLTAVNGGVIDLYAIWQPIAYTVHFDANGALGSMNDLSCVYDQTFQLPPNRFYILGSGFLYWNTEPDNSGTVMPNGASCSNLSAQDGATVTLYAQWAYQGFGLWVISDPEDVTIPEGADASFTVEGGGMDPVGYQWQRNDGSGWRTVADANESTLTLYGVPLKDSGARFRAVVINGDGKTAESDSARLTVIAPPPKTGDAAAPALWLIALAASALCCWAVCRRPKRGGA